MKFLIIFTLITTSGNLFAQDFNEKEFQQLVEAEAKSYQKKQINKGVPQAVNYDLKYHRLEWQIDPEIYYITGAVTSYFVPVVAGFNEIYFDFSNALTIDSIVYNGVNLAFTQPAVSVLQISFPSILTQSVLDSITIFYQGAPVATSGFGSFIQSSHNNDSIIWTLSEPYGALDWWPCKQDLNDKIDSIDIIVTTPLKNRVASQGLLVNETIIGSNKIVHWKHRYPIATYLISLAITNYAAYTDVASLTAGNLNVLNYVYPEDSAIMVTQSPAIIPVLQLFDTLVGDYPFNTEKYGQAQFGWNGGMEHQTMSSMGDFGFNLMAHELAHQWFGDMVTCGSWKEIWLNEGFATYMSGLAHRELMPNLWRAWREGAINLVVSQPNGSVYNPDTTSVIRIFDSRLSYRKGAYLLHMLNWKLGELTFFQGVRNYLNDGNYAYSYAMTDHLKAHLEAVSGQNLTEFFNDWYYGEGHPSYQIGWNQIGNNVSFTINQTQSDVSVSFYEMPVPIYVKGQGMDTTYVFDHQFSGQVFNVTVPFTIDSVFFDPELFILSSNPTVLSLNNILTTEGDVSIYPNPSKDIFNIIVTKTKTVISIELFNSIGQLVTPVIIKKSTNFYQLNLTELPNGNYFIKIKFDDGIIRQQLNKI